MGEDYIAYLCPYCQKNHLQSVATLPYVRGFLLAVQHGHKKLVGCRSVCGLRFTRKQALQRP